MYDIGLVEAEVGFDGMRGKEKLPVAIQDHQEPVQSLERQPITDSNIFKSKSSLFNMKASKGLEPQ